MARGEQPESKHDTRQHIIPHSKPAAGTVSLEAAMILEKSRVKRFFKLLGPGLITGASDDDPSGIGTYAVAGASLGFATLWTALFTLPLMIAALLTCARIGMVSGMGLAAVLLDRFGLAPALEALFERRFEPARLPQLPQPRRPGPLDGSH